jgi:predicted small secreted protein
MTGTTGKRMKRFILLATTLAALAGCNTVAGVGEDVSGGARTVQGWLD